MKPAWLVWAGLTWSGPLAAQAASDSTEMPPPGLGTLRQDDVAVRLAAGNVDVRVLPLDDRIIRLLSPDTYAALHRLRVSHAEAIERSGMEHGVRRPSLFLVTFFGRQPRSPFSPEDLTIMSQNRLFRPVGIIPLSVQWSELTLRQRETANAIFLFEEGVALLEPFTVSYQAVISSQWEQNLRLIEQERARVYSRAAASAPGN